MQTWQEHLDVISVEVAVKDRTHDDVKQLSCVQQKQQWAEDRALRHSKQELKEGQQLAVEGNLLTAFVKEQPDPLQHLSRNTK